ncbi:glucose 1-dehydrogenase [Neobacillus cucumis]|uniref:SDR family NAD(P)-dependent oxidoreductase n=1 Tax=Neobacillus cucumis TaxID=1740721 RepID=UPI0018DF23DC|nr:glucose 1-dehydrogenase [Neobacillus cucumis]MBI0577166.1 glucose 1-dehydrogenase [Neobacillus cucumis]
MKLAGKVAVVTGGASGIGEFTVREMVEEGAKVVIADLNDDLGSKLVQELNQEERQVAYIHVDVTKEDQVENMIEFAVSKFGKLDILFNNAGIGSLSPSAELPFEEWRKVLSVNLDGVFLAAKHAIKAMQKNGGGSIVNTASILGHVGQAQTAPYTASKGAVVNLTRTLAVEYAKDNIRVNAVCPGYIETPLLNQLDEAMKNHLISLHPIGRLGKPEEIAKAVVFLSSDDASFVTGSNLLVDGGYTAQ